MTEFVSIVILATVAEFIWEILGKIWKDGKLNVDLVAVLIIGLILAFSADISFFDKLNIPIKYHVVGVITSGIIIASGSNVAHELLKKIGGRD